MDPSNNRIFTSSSDEVRNVVNGSEVYCLFPQKCRMAFNIELPTDLPSARLEPIMLETLRSQMPTSSIQIMHIEQLTREKPTYFVVALKIPNELIKKLFLAGIVIIHGYIGFSQNQREYPIIDSRPLDEKISMVDDNGDPLPYKATVRLNNN